jgi:hypothetical protein
LGEGALKAFPDPKVPLKVYFCPGFEEQPPRCSGGVTLA